MPPQDRLSQRGRYRRQQPLSDVQTAGRGAARSPEEPEREREREREREAVFLLLPSACHHLQRTGATPHPHPHLLFLMAMPGWRRNLTFCLQRMHQEGRKPKQNERACACPCVLDSRRGAVSGLFAETLCGFRFMCSEFSGSLEVRARARAHVLRGLSEKHLQLGQLCGCTRVRADALSCAPCAHVSPRVCSAASAAVARRY